MTRKLVCGTKPSNFLSQKSLTIWFVALTLTAFGGTTIHAQLPKLKEFKSRFYKIHTNLEKKEALTYARHMDLIFREYLTRFRSFSNKKPSRQNLYITRTRQQYIDLLRSFGIDAAHSGGMYIDWRGIGLATYVGNRSSQRVARVLQHEGLHQFASSVLGVRLPQWVNEGLAEYFEKAIIIKKKVRIGVADRYSISRIRKAVKEGTILDLSDLLSMSYTQWSNNMKSGSSLGSLQYTQSWSVVYFLIHANGGRYRSAFEKYLDLLSHNRSHEKAFKKAFKTDNTRDFHNAWLKFIDEIKPDHFSGAIDQMTTLGEALLYLHQHDHSIPNSVDELLQKLRSMRYYYYQYSHAGFVKTNIDENSDFLYRDAKDNPHSFELIASKDKTLLPSLSASALKPQPYTQWSRDSSGKLVLKILYR